MGNGSGRDDYTRYVALTVARELDSAEAIGKRSGDRGKQRKRRSGEIDVARRADFAEEPVSVIERVLVVIGLDRADTVTD